MEFNDSFGMRYAPEDDDREIGEQEQESTYCKACGCVVYKCEGDAFDYEICDECYKLEENERD